MRFAEVFPLREFGFVPEPGRYLAAVGWLEVVAGLLLAFGPQLLQEISNFVLSVVMIGESGRAPTALCGDPRADPGDPGSHALLLAQVPSTRCWCCGSLWPCVPLPRSASASCCCSTSAGTGPPPRPSSSDRRREARVAQPAGRDAFTAFSEAASRPEG